MKMNPDTPNFRANDIFALALQARAGLYATLRGQPGLALQSKNIEVTFQSEVDASKINP